MPPAYIEVGQLDIFRDEDIRYALTLSRAGVPVELHLHPGVPHEYDAIAFDADVSRRAQSRPRPRAAELVTPVSRQAPVRTRGTRPAPACTREDSR